MTNITKELAAYFAGHFDGEGCISVCVHKGLYGRIHALVQHTHLPTLLKYQECFGGVVYQRKKRSIRHKHIFTWMASTKIECARFLLTIDPYLIQKKPQATLVLDYFAKYMGSIAPTWVAQNLVEELRKLRKVEFDLTPPDIDIFSGTGDN